MVWARRAERHLVPESASLSHSPSSRSASLSRSPSNQSSVSSASSASKLPFFDKYAKMVGDTGAPSPSFAGTFAPSGGGLTRSGGASLGLADLSGSKNERTPITPGTPSPSWAAQAVGRGVSPTTPHFGATDNPTPTRPAYQTTRSQDETTYSPHHGQSKWLRDNEDRTTLKVSQSTPVGLSVFAHDATDRRTRGATERGSSKDSRGTAGGLDACLEDLRIMTEDDDHDGGAALLDDFFGGKEDDLELAGENEEGMDTPKRRQLPFNATPTPTGLSGKGLTHSPSALSLEGRPAFSRSATSPVPSPTHPPPRPSGPPRSHTRAAEPTRISCTTCHVSLSGSPESTQHSGDGQPFCRACYSDRFLPKCRKCARAIEGRAVSDSQGQIRGKYHPGCFNCFECAAPFPGMEFYVFEGRPYCQRDYHRLNGSLCANGACGGPIEGPCVSLVGEEQGGGGRYHPEHFACSVKGCKISLAEQHWVLGGLPWCERHAEEKTDVETGGGARREGGQKGGATTRARKRQTIITRR